jgi:hypothetical protein
MRELEMGSLNHDFIIINPNYRMGVGDAVDTTTPAGFSIQCIRLNSSAAAERLLAGTPLPQLPPNSVVLSREVLAPEGLPLQPHALGSTDIGNMDDALSVVERALTNPQSVLIQNNFSRSTPVYIWHPGRKATRAISPTEE